MKKYYKISYKKKSTDDTITTEYFVMAGKSYAHVYDRAFASAFSGLRRHGEKMVFGTLEMEKISEDEYFDNGKVVRY